VSPDRRTVRTTPRFFEALDRNLEASENKDGQETNAIRIRRAAE